MAQGEHGWTRTRKGMTRMEMTTPCHPWKIRVHPCPTLRHRSRPGGARGTRDTDKERGWARMRMTTPRSNPPKSVSSLENPCSSVSNLAASQQARWRKGNTDGHGPEEDGHGSFVSLREAIHQIRVIRGTSVSIRVQPCSIAAARMPEEEHGWTRIRKRGWARMDGSLREAFPPSVSSVDIRVITFTNPCDCLCRPT